MSINVDTRQFYINEIALLRRELELAVEGERDACVNFIRKFAEPFDTTCKMHRTYCYDDQDIHERLVNLADQIEAGDHE